MNIDLVSPHPGKRTKDEEDDADTWNEDDRGQKPAAESRGAMRSLSRKFLF